MFARRSSFVTLTDRSHIMNARAIARAEQSRVDTVGKHHGRRVMKQTRAQEEILKDLLIAQNIFEILRNLTFDELIEARAPAESRTAKLLPRKVHVDQALTR